MKRKLTLALMPVLLLLKGCATPVVSDVNEDPGLLHIPVFGTEESLDVMTWNLENFGDAGRPELENIAEIILDLDMDIIALQEIRSQTYFEQLLEHLDGWSGYRASPSSSWHELAYIYKNSAITEVSEPFEIYASESTAFPREPYVLTGQFQGQAVVLINNHLKCCGDGIIMQDASDEEYRRQTASHMLEDYIRENLGGANVILLGDLNDEIDEPRDRNVFQNFLDAPGDFYFTTMSLVNDVQQYSYPAWPSFIDHLLINAQLFDEWEASGHVQTIRIDDHMEDYFSVISDHRPVALRLTF